MSTSSTILVPVDFEQTSDHALASGRDLARTLSAADGCVTTTPLRDVVDKQKPLNPDTIRLAAVLAR